MLDDLGMALPKRGSRASNLRRILFRILLNSVVFAFTVSYVISSWGTFYVSLVSRVAAPIVAASAAFGSVVFLAGFVYFAIKTEFLYMGVYAVLLVGLLYHALFSHIALLLTFIELNN